MNDPRRQLAPVMSGKAQNESWYRVFAKGNKTATIELYDEIGIWGTTAKSFVSELKDLDTKTIELHINSVGGDAWDGIAIYNALRDHSANVIVTVDGLAASAAGLVAMAGDEIIMNRHSELMIHEAWGMCMGNAEAMADMVARLDKISANIAAVYAERAGGTVDEWRAAMKAETWYSAEEAVTAGLADGVIATDRDADKEKNRFDKSIFNYAGRSDAPAPRLQNKSEHPTEPNTDADTIPANEQEGTLTAEQLEKLGLPEDATEEQINERLDALTADSTTEGEGDAAATGEGEGAGDAGTASTTEGEGDGTATQPQGDAQPQASARQADSGTVRVDAAVWASIQSQLGRVDELLEEKRVSVRNALVEDAISTGKIPPARRAHWQNAYDKDAEGTTEALNSMEPGLIPVQEMGYGKDIEASADDQDTAYPASWGRNLVARGGDK